MKKLNLGCLTTIKIIEDSLCEGKVSKRPFPVNVRKDDGFSYNLANNGSAQKCVWDHALKCNVVVAI